MADPVRRPAVAGRFYYEDPRRLRMQVEEYTGAGGERLSCMGIVAPHAGFMYSGGVAGAVYSSVTIPRTVLLLGPNHTGLGAAGAVYATGSWSTPLGDIPVETDLADRLLEGSSLLSADRNAHLYEHSLEVQLPFIQCLREDARIVPLTLMGFGLDECREIGRAVAEAVTGYGREDVLIVASSDMSHYLPHDLAKERDRLAIDRILALDPEGLFTAVRQHGISMCGSIPVTIMLFAAILMGAGSAELVRYATSGDVSGDYEHVVGYAGMVVR